MHLCVFQSILLSVRVFSWNWIISFFLFLHGARNPYEVVCDNQIFWKNYFCPQNWGNGPKLIFFHGDTNSQQLKDGGKFLVGHGQKIDVANWSRDCKFTISQERRDGIS